MSNTDFGFGQMQPEDTTTDYNAISFIVRQILGGMAIAKVVKVLAVHASPDASSHLPPTVDVQPLVGLVDGNNNVTPYATVFGIPCMRTANRFVRVDVPPTVGDIGVMLCLDRDSSKIANAIATQTDPAGADVKPGAPGSARKFDLSDGVYIGSLIPAQVPAGYIAVDASGNIALKDAAGATLQSDGTGGWTLASKLTVQGDLNATGAIVGGFGGGDQVSLQTHTHTGVTTGGGTSGPPTPGS